MIELAGYPDGLTERWDGVTGTRAATAEETAAYDDMEKSKAARTGLDNDTALRTVFNAAWDQEQRLRALEGAPPITKAQYRQAWEDSYKSHLPSG